MRWTQTTFIIPNGRLAVMTGWMWADGMWRIRKPISSNHINRQRERRLWSRSVVSMWPQWGPQPCHYSSQRRGTPKPGTSRKGCLTEWKRRTDSKEKSLKNWMCIKGEGGRLSCTWSQSLREVCNSRMTSASGQGKCKPLWLTEQHPGLELVHEGGRGGGEVI